MNHSLGDAIPGTSAASVAGCLYIPFVLVKQPADKAETGQPKGTDGVVAVTQNENDLGLAQLN